MKKNSKILAILSSLVAVVVVLIAMSITNSSPQTMPNTSKPQQSPATNLPLNSPPPTQNSSSSPFLDYSYDYVISKLQNSLGLIGVTMTDPAKFNNPLDIAANCNFMSDTSKQALVKYCTISELSDKNDTLGNINMIGSTNSPGLIIVLVSSDTKFSNMGKIKGILDTVITDTICSCWNTERPNGYVTSADMIDTLRDMQISTSTHSSTAPTISLGNMHLQLEIINNGDSYMWKLLVAR